MKRETDLDRKVLALLVEGCDNKEISHRLGMAERTVKAHFNKLFVLRGITDGVKRVKLAVMEFESRLEQGPCETVLLTKTEPTSLPVV